jgi:pimeloyl-ACP methyl ester carboxylesterase
MSKVISRDGTTIAFNQSGQRSAVILVTGALATRSTAAGLAASLAPHFTVFAYDRRGRGESGDATLYAVEREVEDIEALITEAGGSAFVFGHSSGAVLALEAAQRLSTRIPKLAVYEPPFIIDESRPPFPKNYVQHLTKLIAAGQRGDAVEFYMPKGLLVPAEFIAPMREKSMTTNDDSTQPPSWVAMEKVAHTLVYDGIIMGDTQSGNPLPSGK